LIAKENIKIPAPSDVNVARMATVNKLILKSKTITATINARGFL
jgi:hypothetical protein